MIVETPQSVVKLFNMSKKFSTAFAIPIFSDIYKHPAINDLCLIYLYLGIDKEEGYEFIIPINHPESLTSFDLEQANRMLSNFNQILTTDKKELLHILKWNKFEGEKILDLNLANWFHNNIPLDISNNNTIAHNFIERKYYNFPKIGTLIPIYKHLEKCRRLKEIAYKQYDFDKIDREAYNVYNNNILYNLYKMENSGLFTNTGYEYTQYNLYTTTGRPSNRYGGINYAALNKDDGTREKYISRFRNGNIVECDFDAYHLRLMAEVVGYKFPKGSVHNYLGQQYFDKNKLTKEEYNESKSLSFKILYGGIPKEMTNIEFFNKIDIFTKQLWKEYKAKKYISTYLYKRKLYASNLVDMNPPKLLNYFLQSLETEYNNKILDKLNNVMDRYKSKLILYTYDSFTFDFNPEDGDTFLNDVEEALRFPIKTKSGDNYNELQ